MPEKKIFICKNEECPKPKREFVIERGKWRKEPKFCGEVCFWKYRTGKMLPRRTDRKKEVVSRAQLFTLLKKWSIEEGSDVGAQIAKDFINWMWRKGYIL